MDAPSPLPLADSLTTAIVPSHVQPLDPVVAGDCNAPETFALLLSLAQSMLEPVEADASGADVGEPRGAAASDVPAPLDSLLFLANVNVATPVAPQLAGAAPVVDAPVRAAPRASAVLPPIAGTAEVVPSLAAAVAPSAAIDVLAPAPTRIDGGRTTSASHDPRGSEMRTTATLDAAASEASPLDLATASKQGSTIASSAPRASVPVVSAAEASPPSSTPHAGTSTPVAPTPIVTLHVPMHDAQWREQFAERIVTLVARGTERAEIRVSPPELGPVEVRIDLKGGEATLTIVAVQPAARDALESALPLLRDLLAQQGLALGEATVRDGRADAEAGGRDDMPPPASGGGAHPAADETTTTRAVVRRLVDVFA